MSKKLLFTIAVLLSLILIGVIFFLGGQKSEENSQDGENVSFPTSNEREADVMYLNSRSGRSINAQVLIQQPTAELLGDGFYRINEANDSFGFYYDRESNSGMVLLFEKPLGVTRLKAETFVRDILERGFSMSEQEICDLNIKVLTNEMVDIAYSGFNLGFSFCPNAIELP